MNFARITSSFCLNNLLRQLFAIIAVSPATYAQSWSIETLPSLAPSYPQEIYPIDLNNSGHVLARIFSLDQNGQGVPSHKIIVNGNLNQFGPSSVLHTSGAELNRIIISGLNGAGTGIGMAHSGVHPGLNSAFLFSAQQSLNLHSQLQEFLGRPVLESEGFALSDSGHATGKFRTSANTFPLPPETAFIYDNGALAVIPSPNGDYYPSIDPMAINNQGQVAGRIGSRAFVYTHYGAFSSRYLPIPAGLGPSSEASDINDQGSAVGYALDAGGRTQALLWHSESVVNLGVQCPPNINGLPGQSRANAVNYNNSVTYIAGWCNQFAVVWFGSVQGGFQMAVLNDLLPQGSGWLHLERAIKVNDQGQILGTGFRIGQAEVYNFLMSPPSVVPPSPSPSPSPTAPAALTPTMAPSPAATFTPVVPGNQPHNTPTFVPTAQTTPQTTPTIELVITATSTPTGLPGGSLQTPAGITPVPTLPPAATETSGPADPSNLAARIDGLLLKAKEFLRDSARKLRLTRPLTQFARKRNQKIKLARLRLLETAHELDEIARNFGEGDKNTPALNKESTTRLINSIKQRAWGKVRRLLLRMRGRR